MSAGRPGASRARQFGTLLGLFALSLALWILTPHFLTVSNLLNVLEQSSINAIVAAGMTFAIISGECTPATISNQLISRPHETAALLIAAQP